MKRLLAAFTFVAIFLTGCGDNTAVAPPTETMADATKKIVIAFLPKQKGVPYFTSCAEGAELAAKELGNIEIKYDGPTDGSPEKAAELIEQWVLKGVDVIAVSCNDPAVLSPALKKAREKGVKVITWDADSDKDSRDFFVNQPTAEQIGFGLVDAMAKDLGGDSATGEVAIVTARLTAANQNEWMKHMNVRLAKYPGLKLVATKPSNEDQKLAFEVTSGLIKAYPGLKGVFGISSVAFPGAAEAIKQAGKSGSVLITGLSTPNDMKAYVMEGTVKSVLLWDTRDLGYLTVEVAAALARGELKPGATTFTSRKLGERKIEGDNVLLGDPMVFNKENIGKYDF
mgnify:CR=1 FL=1